MPIDVEQAFAQNLPLVRFQLALTVGIDAKQLIVSKAFERHKLGDEGGDSRILADYQHFRVLVRIEAGDIRFEFAEFGPAGAKPDPRSEKRRVGNGCVRTGTSR